MLVDMQIKIVFFCSSLSFHSGDWTILCMI